MFDTVKLYLFGAAALGLFALVLFAGYQYDQHKLDAAKMDTLAVEMKNTAAALTQLQAGVDASNDAIKEMTDAQARVTQHGGVVRARVQTMRGSNDAIRTYLDTTLPVGGCLLDDTCPASSAAPSPVSGAASAVR